MAAGVVYNSQQNAQNVARQALQTARQEASLTGESVKQQFGMPRPSEQQAPQSQGVDVAALKQQEEARIQELRNMLASMQAIDSEMAAARQQREQQNQAWQQQQEEAMQAAASPSEQQAQAAQEQFIPAAINAKRGSREMGRQKG